MAVHRRLHQLLMLLLMGMAAFASTIVRINTNLNAACDDINDIRWVSLLDGNGKCNSNSDDAGSAFKAVCNANNSQATAASYATVDCSGSAVKTDEVIDSPTPCIADENREYNLNSLSCGMPPVLASSTKKFPYLAHVYLDSKCEESANVVWLYDGNCIADDIEPDKSRAFLIENDISMQLVYENDDCSGSPNSTVAFPKDRCVMVNPNLYVIGSYDEDRTVVSAFKEIKSASTVAAACWLLLLVGCMTALVAV
eukprot:m.43851 g.43851  ORF g.43851 m.43851 type:complete len:254 (+) comp12966_c0_seq2:143-904(+)